MPRRALSRGLVIALLPAVLSAGCRFDPAGQRSGPGLDAGADGGAPDGAAPDGGGDAALPSLAAPLGVSIPARPGICPAQLVNSATVGAVQVTVTLGPDSRPSHEVWLRVSRDASRLVEPLPQAATQGSGSVAFGVALSSLDDGPLELTAWVTDGLAESPAVTHDARLDTTAELLVDPVVTPVSDVSQWVSGMAEDGAEVLVTNQANGATALITADADGYFQAELPLDITSNQLSVRSTDIAANRETAWVDRFGQPLIVVVMPGTGGVGFRDVSSAQLVTPAPTGCSNTAAASFAFLRAPDLAAGDTAPDLFISCVNMLLLNDGQGGFSAPALAVSPQGDRGAVWGDFDNDGDQDLLLVRQSTTDLLLYRNELRPNGTLAFTQTGGLIPIDPVNPEGVAWIDYDGDGWLDIFLNDGARNELLRNNGPGQPFSVVSDPVGVNTLGDTLNNGSWVAACDFDNDGDVDLALSDDTGAGFLLRNTGGGFTDATAATLAAFVNPAKRGLAFGDFDGNGAFDLFVAQGGAAGSNALLRFDPGPAQFAEVAAAAGVDLPGVPDGFAWGDIDHNGHLDLVYYTVPAWDRVAVVQLLNHGDTNADGVPDFTTHSVEVTVPNPGGFVPESVLLADVDNDGDLDVFLSSRGSQQMLFANLLNDPPSGGGPSQNHRFLKVLLLGNGVDTNRSAVGSVVLLRDCASQALLGIREVNGGRGNGGQDSPVLHFGGMLPSRCVEVEARFLGGSPMIEQVRPIELLRQTLILFQP